MYRKRAISTVPVAIVGAGPYGLAIAAQLRAAGVPFRILGEPMAGWREGMPAGMFLKTSPDASSIADPGARHTLAAFRAAEGRAHPGEVFPVPLTEFIRYGEWFQACCVPELERVAVERIGADPAGFRLVPANGEEFTARSVVLATGQTPYAWVPPELANAAADGLVSHSCEHPDLSRFAGRRVAVIGAGQSALESAALLHEAGAEPTVVARTARLSFGAPPAADHSTERPLRVRALQPGSPLGPGWPLVGFSRLPAAFQYLPEHTRTELVRTVLGPSGAWWLRERVAGRFPVLTGHAVTEAQPRDGRVRLRLRGSTAELEADRVLAATGYRVDLDRIPLLAPELRHATQRTATGAPLLSAHFESTVPGLYFAGLAAAATFGPLLRFVCGTGFAARRISRSLAQRR